MKVDKEIQFTTWLSEQINKIVTPLGFNVESECENKCTIPSIFSTPFIDCVIYHEKSFCKDFMNGLSLILCDDLINDQCEVLDNPKDLFGSHVHTKHSKLRQKI